MTAAATRLPWPRPRTAPHEPDPHWRNHAACAGADPDQFFPDPGGRTPGGTSCAEAAAAAVAHRYCAGCPVRLACHADAEHAPHLALGVRAGVWRRAGHPPVALLGGAR